MNGCVTTAVYERDRFSCRYCGLNGRDFAHWLHLCLDHVVPRSQGGADTEDNLVVACHSCNTLSADFRAVSGQPVADVLLAKSAHIGAKRQKEELRWREWVLDRLR